LPDKLENGTLYDETKVQFGCGYLETAPFVEIKIPPAIFSQINSSINSKDFGIKFVIKTPSESILILN